MNNQIHLPWGLAALLLTACGGGPESSIVCPRAAYELNCPEAQLAVSRISGSTYAVEGCGASATYTCMGGMGNYACSREGDVTGRSETPQPPPSAEDVTDAGRPVSDEILPRARHSLGCENVRVFQVARLTLPPMAAAVTWCSPAWGAWGSTTARSSDGGLLIRTESPLWVIALLSRSPSLAQS